MNNLQLQQGLQMGSGLMGSIAPFTGPAAPFLMAGSAVMGVGSAVAGNAAKRDAIKDSMGRRVIETTNLYAKNGLLINSPYGVNGNPLTRGKGVPDWDVNYQEFHRPSAEKPFGVMRRDIYPSKKLFDVNTIVPQINKGVDNTAPTVDNTAVKRAINNNGKFGGLGLLGSDNRSAVEKAIDGDNNGSGDFADYMDKISDLESTDYSDAAKKADVYNKIGAGIGLGANLLGVMNALNSKEPDRIMTPAQNTVNLRKDQSAFINYQEGQAKQGSAAMSRLAKEMGADPLMTAGLLSRTYNDSMLKTHAQAEQMRNQTYNQEKQLNSNILANAAQLKTRTDMFNAQMIAQANAQRGQDLTASLAGLANILPGYGEAKFKNQLWANSLDDQVTNSRLSSYYGNY